MPENIGEIINQFKTRELASGVIRTIADSQIVFNDGRVYTLYEPDKNNPESFLCIFDFDRNTLKRESVTDHDGSNVGAVKVDLKVDGQGHIVGLNEVNLEVGSTNEKYLGATIAVCFRNLEYQVRYKAESPENPKLVFDGFYFQSGDLCKDTRELKDTLMLPDTFDILETTIKLLTEPNDIRTLRQNPFVSAA